MNNHILQVFLYEFRRNIRRKGYLFATLGIPILGFISMYVFQGVSQLALENAAQSTSDSFIERLKNVGYIDETGLLIQPGGVSLQSLIEFSDVQSAQSALDAGEISTYFIIPQDFFESGEATQVLQEMSITLIGSDPIYRLLRDNIGTDIDPQVLRRLQNPSDLTVTNLSRAVTGDAESLLEADLILIYVFALIFLLAIFMTNGYLMSSIIEEKETRLIEILISSLKPLELLTGKILALGLLGLIQVSVWLIWMMISLQTAVTLPALAETILGQIEFPFEQLPIMFAYLMLGYLFFAGGYSMIGALAGSMRGAQQFVAVLVIPAIIPFYFFTIIAETPDGTLPVILSMIPFTSPLAMMMRLSVGAVPIEQILFSLLILAISVIGIVWLTARIFRFQILLAGQPPRLRDLPRLIMD